MDEYKFEDWLDRLNEIYQEVFVDNSEVIDNILKSTVIGENLNQMNQDPVLVAYKKEQAQLVHIHLKNLRDYLKKKLSQNSSDFKLEMEDMENAYLRIQNMNTDLINECNKLREEKQKLQNNLGIQKKAYREIIKEITGNYDIDIDSYKLEEEEALESVQEVEAVPQEIQLKSKKVLNKPIPFVDYQQK